MTKIIEGDLILDKDENYFDESIEVKGNIISKGYKRNLKVNGDITAWDINAKNITAWDINAKNITAEDINAKNITAWDINAKNIDYYAVCFAYYNIGCNSIKGRRNNSKHFVLDGKINIKGEKQ